ncbi:hypothetical protein SNE25_12110 [Mucilaginibacter sabulilitoris]|uniref:Uncharacterized protein n=1 Tax=Mucilaginibacter sabulilitoris TaxID=1173583 RepID=A0ABZ0TUX3_9SPHI|nr:hypothetical protein [Mucilaginibacter sabulilitoris]WPU96262.1 hypothetical protein SNE25_12110 [Mucilaginibacter sabulilitoris]
MAIQVADFNLKIKHFKEKINARGLIYTLAVNFMGYLIYGWCYYSTL